MARNPRLSRLDKIGMTCTLASGAAVVLFHLYVTPIRYLALTIVLALATTMIGCTFLEVTLQNMKFRKSRKPESLKEPFRVAVIAPFARWPMTGVINGCRTKDGRMVETRSFGSVGSVPEERWHAIVVFEDFAPLVEERKLTTGRVLVVPRLLRHRHRVSVPGEYVVSDIRRLPELLDLDLTYPTRGSMLAAKVTLVFAAALTALLVIWVIKPPS